MYGVYEVYEAYEVDDVDENGRSILKQPMVSSFCQGQSSFTQISRNPQWLNISRDETFKRCLIKPPLRYECKGRALKHLL